jgi:hypothetical protein
MRYDSTGRGIRTPPLGRTQASLGDCPVRIPLLLQAEMLLGLAVESIVHSMMVCFSEPQFA